MSQNTRILASIMMLKNQRNLFLEEMTSKPQCECQQPSRIQKGRRKDRKLEGIKTLLEGIIRGEYAIEELEP